MEELLGKTLCDFYEDCRKQSFENDTRAYQHKPFSHNCVVVDCLNKSKAKGDIIREIERLSKEVKFQDFVLTQKRKETENKINEYTRKQLSCNDTEDYRRYDILINSSRDYLKVLSWNWYVENNCNCEFFSELENWYWMLLCNLYGYYCSQKWGSFLDFKKDCPLDKYLANRNMKHDMESNYGLLTIGKDWTIKYLTPPRVYVPQLDTHILLRHVPVSVLQLLDSYRKDYPFKLSLRPDYNVCGDGISEIGMIFEEKQFGKDYVGKLSKIDYLSKYYDRDWTNDWLTVHRNGQEVTFEEVLEDGPHDRNDYVTQVVHMVFKVEECVEYITHLDHEYVFYTEEAMTIKGNQLLEKGKARPKYKTFKIDDAHIPYSLDTQNNLLYQVLIRYFAKGNLVDEFFHC